MPDHLINDLQTRVLASVEQLNGNPSQIVRDVEIAYRIEKVLAEKGLTLQDPSTYELLKRALEGRISSSPQQGNQLMLARMQLDLEKKDVHSTLRKTLFAQYLQMKDELLKIAQKYSFKEEELNYEYHFSITLDPLEHKKITFYPNSLRIEYKIKDTSFIRNDDKQHGEYPGFYFRIKPRVLRKNSLRIDNCSARLPYQSVWGEKLSYDKVMKSFLEFYLGRGDEPRALDEFKRYHQNVLSLPSELQNALEGFPEKLKEQKERREQNAKEKLEREQKKQENLKRFLDEMSANP